MPESPTVGLQARTTQPSVPVTVVGVAYTVLAVAALSRSIYQATTGVASGRAWIAVALSTMAGILYVIAAIGLRRGTRFALRVSRWCLMTELVGVVVVSLVEIGVGGFGRAAVWSGFGVGYGYAPLLLPVVGLWLTRKSRQ